MYDRSQQNLGVRQRRNIGVMPPYDAKYSVGSRVRIATPDELEAFRRDWKYHHPVTPEQLRYAGHEARVEGVSFYHGGDPLYELESTPGLWHEPCLCSI